MELLTTDRTTEYDGDSQLRELLRLYPLALARLSSPATFQFRQPEQRRNCVHRNIEEWLEVKLTVERLLARLSRREQQAVQSYYFHGYRQSEVARTLGVSQSRLSRLLSVARQSLLFFYRRYHNGVINQPSQSVKRGAGR